MSKIITIEGMSCQNCVNHVKSALEDVKGLTKIDVEVGKAVVDGEASDKDIKDAIEDMGYDVTSIK
ncbi:heavy-metal-associated domain-containing protein [Clostridium sp. B9]|uniref:heavy-metal-associated domain-containing protein n=1 Tax=Clostridium sp. B9 TaxID=3423224 RepID=UPI003D2EB51C